MSAADAACQARSRVGEAIRRALDVGALIGVKGDCLRHEPSDDPIHNQRVAYFRELGEALGFCRRSHQRRASQAR